jgi:hypothetical protein
MKFRMCALVALLLTGTPVFAADGPSARSLFSTGYGVTFDAEAPSLSGNKNTVQSTLGRASDETSDRRPVPEGETSDLAEETQSLEPAETQALTLGNQTTRPIVPQTPQKEPPKLESREETDSDGQVAPSVAKQHGSKADVVREPKPKAGEDARGQGETASQAQYAGLSYSLFKETSGQGFKRVSPKQSFKTGDRLYVEVMANVNGTLITGNINPKNVKTVLAVDRVAPGRATRIPSTGALKFVGDPGTEQLVFVLSENAKAQVQRKDAARFLTDCNRSTTRSLVVDDSVGNKYQVLDSSGSCAPKSSGGRTRSIVVDVEEDSGYGVVEKNVLGKGNLLSLFVKLRHE